jgi:nucleoside-diphosphate-sugar epimerase
MTIDTVVVTGAFGQVGKRCAQILLERGRTVIAVDLRNDKTEAAAAELAALGGPGELIPAYVDLTDADAVADLLVKHQPGAIVHLAGLLAPTSYRNPALARKVNVGGTENLLAGAAKLATPPLFVLASSASVYGSVNPYRFPERITAQTPVNPIDQYGEDKVLAEAAVRGSGLPAAMLRLAGVISPDGASTMSGDHLLLMRATPGDNRMHTVDARDVALAFANAVDRGPAIAGKVLLIAGDQSHIRTHRSLEDEMMTAVGLGALGPLASLPGDPDDDRGWSFTGWFDTTESQDLLEFQEHSWKDTVSWVAEDQARLRSVLRLLSPVLRPTLLTVLALQRRVERRGRYADPWGLISSRYGNEVLAAPNNA